MKKRNFNLFLTGLIIFTSIISPIKVFASEPQDIRQYEEPPYSYTYFEGGNCTWLAWEMAYQEWGLELPPSGDARLWTGLKDETVKKDEFKYTMNLSNAPIKNSIAIFQPEDLRTIAKRAFDNDHYGHVAWVYDVDSRTNPHKIYTIESSVYPPKGGKHWHGCWWNDRIYNISNLPTMKYLYVDELEFTNQKYNLTFNIQGKNVIAEKINDNTYRLTTKGNDKIRLKTNQEKLMYIDSVDKVVLEKNSGKDYIEIDVNSDEIYLEIKDSCIKITPSTSNNGKKFANVLDIENSDNLKGLLLLFEN